MTNPTERPEGCRVSPFHRGLIIGYTVAWVLALVAIGFIYHNATVVWHR